MSEYEGPVYYDSPDQVIPVTAVFTKADGTGTVPVAVVMALTDPFGNATTYTWNGTDPDPDHIVSDGSGKFHVWLASLFNGMTPSPPGMWTYTWVGSGGMVENGAQVKAGSFRVLSLNSTTGISRFYCSLEDLKSRLDINPDDHGDDYEIQLALQSVTNWITSYCGQHFYRVDEVRTYAPVDGVFSLDIDPCVSVNSLKLDYDGDGVYEVTWTEDVEYQVLRYPKSYNRFDGGVERPDNHIQVTMSNQGNPQGAGWLPFIWPYTRKDRVQIDATWGWPMIPPNVTQAALILAADLFKAKDAPWGVAGIGDLGMVKVQSNPWVVELLRDYINMRNKVGV